MRSERLLIFIYAFYDEFVLIYTGQRRLARNLLRDVVGCYVGNEVNPQT